MALAEVFEAFAGPDAPVEFSAYDGSHVGTPGSGVKVTVRSPVAVAYLAQAPGALGLARAYVSGHLDIDGDMYEALSRMTKAQSISIGTADKLRLLRALGGPKLLLNRVPPPPQEVSPRRRWAIGRLHSKSRDARAISHHYDVSNRFYEWVLGPTMAYTCACYPREDATLEEAQTFKFDLVARKLGLQQGMRLLDVGCGWGGMVIHAAREYGVKALGVTLSAQQAAWAQAAIEREGLSGLAEVRHLDYRDVLETGFDAVSSIGLTEHVGKDNLPAYFAYLLGKLHPGGRLLNHCITRPDNIEPAIRRQGFINRYVFPDGELEGPGYLISLMHDAGFEVRHEENLREHYAKTLAAWCANLDAHWDEAVEEVGQGTARVWRLYMAGSRLGFDTNHIELHQVLGVRLHSDGTSGMPLRPDWEPRQVLTGSLSRTSSGPRSRILIRGIAVASRRLRLSHARDLMAGQRVRGTWRRHERRQVGDGPGREQGGHGADRDVPRHVRDLGRGCPGEGDGGHAAARGGQRGQARVRPGDHDQVGLPGRQRHRLREEHGRAQLAGQLRREVVVGHDRAPGDGGQQRPPRRSEARAREDGPQRGRAPGHRGAVHGVQTGEHVGGDAEGGGAPPQLADARGGPRQHVRPGSFVGGDVQAVGRAEPAGRLGIGGEADHRGGGAGAAAQDLVAQRRQAGRLGRGQAVGPRQPGELTQAVAHPRVRPDPELLQGAQSGQRGGEQRRVGEPGSGQPAEHHHDPPGRLRADVDVRIGCRAWPARPQQPRRGPGAFGQLVRRGRGQGDPYRRPAIARREHAERQMPRHLA
jgi:cyclopropane-fatty-acyl-phospholipid synthase